MEEKFNNKKRTELYNQSCNIVQRSEIWKRILRWLDVCKQEDPIKWSMCVHNKSLNDQIETGVKSSDLLYRDKVIVKYDQLLNILETQIIPKGID